LTFSSALYMSLRPFLRPRYLWPLIIFLVGSNIVVTRTLMGTTQGWQIYWVLNNIIVLAAVIGVSNLYVQGGMRLRQVAWFSLILAAYDLTFSIFVPISQHLADRFHGQPLDAAMGWIIGSYSSNLGIGDLLVFTLFTIIAFFGSILPSLSPLLIQQFGRTGIGITIPVQTFFGPVALLTYYLLRRTGPERSMAQWLSVQSAAGHEPIRVVRRPRRLVTPAPVDPTIAVKVEQGD